jgi:hypothetical protein
MNALFGDSATPQIKRLVKKSLPSYFSALWNFIGTAWDQVDTQFPTAFGVGALFFGLAMEIVGFFGYVASGDQSWIAAMILDAVLMSFDFLLLMTEGSVRRALFGGLAKVWRERRQARTDPLALCPLIALQLQKTLESREEELLGARSTLARARTYLQSALQKANANHQHWVEWSTKDPDNSEFTENEAEALELRASLSEALISTEKRRLTIREFIGMLQGKIESTTTQMYHQARTLELVSLREQVPVLERQAADAVNATVYKLARNLTDLTHVLTEAQKIVLLGQASHGEIGQIERKAIEIVKTEQDDLNIFKRLSNFLAA